MLSKWRSNSVLPDCRSPARHARTSSLSLITKTSYHECWRRVTDRRPGDTDPDRGEELDAPVERRVERDDTEPWRPAGMVKRDLEGEAMRRRIAARLFGAEVESLCIGRFRVLETLGEGGMG